MSTGKVCLLITVGLTALHGRSWAQDNADADEINDEIKTLEKRIAARESESMERGDGASIWDAVSVGGVLAYTYQGEGSSGASDPHSWGLPVQPELSINPTDKDEVFFKLGFAAGDGLNATTNFTLAPWAADLSEDVKNLSGGSRDYLLTAWYKRSFEIGAEHSLAITGGIIDAADYLDENAYSNDEYTQFMNEALVNAPNAFLPSYEVGAALEWDWNRFASRAVVMEVSDNDDGRSFLYYGTQVSLSVDTPLGEGNYRLIYSWSSEDFSDPVSSTYKSRYILLVSCDQELGPALGAWIRLGRQDDEALITYESIVSGGFNISGSLWGRDQDNIGIGFGHLKGAEQKPDSLSRTAVFETYARFGLNDSVAVTGDIQYMDDVYLPDAADQSTSGWIAGLRLAVEF